jgi:hypothetical protein
MLFPSFHTEFLELNIINNKTLENFNDPKRCQAVCGVKVLCIAKTMNVAEKYHH